MRGLDVRPGSRFLDVAAGTGSITRLLSRRGAQVVSVDQSENMLQHAVRRGATGVLATGMALPLRSDTFDGVAFGYLLRYVTDVASCMSELARVVKPGGRIGMLEFGRPAGWPGVAWRLYTQIGLPMAGTMIGNGWGRVGSFLGRSIDEFHAEYPPEVLASIWQASGLTDIGIRRMSLGGGLLMWGTKQ